jgi:cytidine deaminase
VLEPDVEQLIEAARAVQGGFALSERGFTAGTVAAALRTATGAIHTGVCLDLACGLGSCAEHAAVTEMLKHREVEIDAIVAVDDRGVVPPCGRCRELVAQLTPRNADTRVVVAADRVARLRELLPEPWLGGEPSGAGG